jgi:tRNA (guanine-N7-)-methyltransferase
LHLATDWEDYAIHMMRTLEKSEVVKNSAGPNQYAQRSPYRPIITKFEQRAIHAGRQIFDLQFIK